MDNPIKAYREVHPEQVVWSPERGWHDAPTTFRQLRRGEDFQTSPNSPYYRKVDHWTYRLLELDTREPVPGMTYSLREHSVDIGVMPV